MICSLFARCSLAGTVLLLLAGTLPGDDGPIAARPDASHDRPRARDVGVAPGILPTGPLNAITAVPGVRVGHHTRKTGDNVRTGVTAILPHGGNIRQDKVPGAVVISNGFGKLAAAPMYRKGRDRNAHILTNTLSVPAAIEAQSLDARPALQRRFRSDQCPEGETHDGRLSNPAQSVTPIRHPIIATPTAPSPRAASAQATTTRSDGKAASAPAPAASATPVGVLFQNQLRR
jgi:D-aminopeptidase